MCNNRYQSLVNQSGCGKERQRQSQIMKMVERLQQDIWFCWFETELWNSQRSTTANTLMYVSCHLSSTQLTRNFKSLIAFTDQHYNIKKVSTPFKETWPIIVNHLALWIRILLYYLCVQANIYFYEMKYGTLNLSSQAFFFNVSQVCTFNDRIQNCYHLDEFSFKLGC